MMYHKVLVTGEPTTPAGQDAFNQLKRKWADRQVEFIPIDVGSTKEEALKALSAFKQDAAVVGLVTFGFKLHRLQPKPITADLFADLPSFRLVTGGGAGFDYIDIDSFTQHGIYYANTPNAVAEPTATLTSILILAVLRRVPEGDHFVRSGQWKAGSSLGAAPSPNGAVLGIVGYGHIGKIVAKQVRPFGMVVKYHNRRRLSPDEEEGAEYVDNLQDLLGQSDVVSLNLPLSPATHHYISTKELTWFKKGSILVNTARGPVVDEEALVQALKSGHLSGAGLDVFENEPEVHPWLKESNKVLLTPHVGGAEAQTLEHVEGELCDNVDSFLETGKPANAANHPKDK